MGLQPGNKYYDTRVIVDISSSKQIQLGIIDLSVNESESAGSAMIDIPTNLVVNSMFYRLPNESFDDAAQENTNEPQIFSQSKLFKPIKNNQKLLSDSELVTGAFNGNGALAVDGSNILIDYMNILSFMATGLIKPDIFNNETDITEQLNSYNFNTILQNHVKDSSFNLMSTPIDYDLSNISVLIVNDNIKGLKNTTNEQEPNVIIGVPSFILCDYLDSSYEDALSGLYDKSKFDEYRTQYTSPLTQGDALKFRIKADSYNLDKNNTVVKHYRNQYYSTIGEQYKPSGDAVFDKTYEMLFELTTPDDFPAVSSTSEPIYIIKTDNTTNTTSYFPRYAPLDTYAGGSSISKYENLTLDFIDIDLSGILQLVGLGDAVSNDEIQITMNLYSNTKSHRSSANIYNRGIAKDYVLKLDYNDFSNNGVTISKLIDLSNSLYSQDMTFNQDYFDEISFKATYSSPDRLASPVDFSFSLLKLGQNITFTDDALYNYYKPDYRLINRNIELGGFGGTSNKGGALEISESPQDYGGWGAGLGNPGITIGDSLITEFKYYLEFDAGKGDISNVEATFRLEDYAYPKLDVFYDISFVLDFSEKESVRKRIPLDDILLDKDTNQYTPQSFTFSNLILYPEPSIYHHMGKTLFDMHNLQITRVSTKLSDEATKLLGSWKLSGYGVGPNKGSYEWFSTWSPAAARESQWDDSYIFTKERGGLRFSINYGDDKKTYTQGIFSTQPELGVAEDNYEINNDFIYEQGETTAAYFNEGEGDEDNQLELMDYKAFIGLIKVTNGEEINSLAKALNVQQRRYVAGSVVTYNNTAYVELSISVGTGWWTFKLSKPANE